MGIRYLLLVLLIWLVAILIRKLVWQRRLERRNREIRQAKNMVSCEYCGLHLPQDEAVQKQDRFFCCQEHADAGAKEEE